MSHISATPWVPVILLLLNVFFYYYFDVHDDCHTHLHCIYWCELLFVIKFIPNLITYHRNLQINITHNTKSQSVFERKDTIEFVARVSWWGPSAAETALPSGAPSFKSSVKWFIDVSCHFVLWSLYSLSFDLRLLVTPLESSNFS